MIDKIKDMFKSKKLKILTDVKLNRIQKLYKIKNDFNMMVNKEIYDYNNIKINLDNRKQIIEFSKKIKDKKNVVLDITDDITKLFKDKKRTYIVSIFLKSNKVKSFNIQENINTEGFVFKKGYYSIDRSSTITQNNEAFLFYFEGISAPINFKTLKYVRDEEGKKDNYEVELSCKNLIDVVNGKAFNGIISLGKNTSQPIDMKMVLIGGGLIILGILQATGTIDIMTYLGI